MSLNQTSEAEVLLKTIREDWDKIKRTGAFVFDIDHTLMPPDESLSKHIELKMALVKLLKEGMRIILISGGPGAVVDNRILQELRVTEGARDHLSQITVYANGGGSVFLVDKDGQFGEVVSYSAAHQIPSGHLIQVKQCLEELILNKFGFSDEEFESFIQALRRKRETQWHEKPIQFTELWNRSSEETSLSLFEDDLMADVKSGKGQATISFPFINTRSSEYDDAGNLLGVSGFAPTGFYSLSVERGDYANLDIRDRIIEKIKEAIPDVYEHLVIRKAGRSTLDITKQGTDKASALLHFIKTQELTGDHIYYFGDEFYPGGNDMPILEDEELSAKKVHAVALNQSEKPSGMMWLGSGSKPMQSFLFKVTEGV